MKRMVKSFVIGAAFRDGHLRAGGQVPRRDLDVDKRAIDRLVSQPAPPWSVDRMLARPVFSARGAVADLGLDPAVEGDWSRFLQKAIYNSPREIEMRQQIMERLLREDWPPELRKAVFQRAVSLYRNSVEKAFVVLSPDELRKAKGEKDEDVKLKGKDTKPKDKDAKPKDKAAEEKKAKDRDPRGGNYHRRVPHESGKGYRYYYDEDKYHSRPDAHVSGKEMSKRAMGKHISRVLDKAGDAGCSVSDLKELSKKYGAKAVGGYLQKDCGEGGASMFMNGRFYKRRK